MAKDGEFRSPKQTEFRPTQTNSQNQNDGEVIVRKKMGRQMGEVREEPEVIACVTEETSGLYTSTER